MTTDNELFNAERINNSNLFEDDYILQILTNLVFEYNCPNINKSRTMDKYAVQITSYMMGKVVSTKDDSASEIAELNEKLSSKTRLIAELQANNNRLHDALARLCDVQIDAKLKSNPDNLSNALDVAIKLLASTHAQSLKEPEDNA